MYEDIDYLYEKHLEALVEEQYQTPLTQKDRDLDRFEMWGVILGDTYTYGNKNKKKHLKDWFKAKYGIMPCSVTWDWALMNDCPVYKGLECNMICVDECVTASLPLVVQDYNMHQKITFGNIPNPSYWGSMPNIKNPEKENNMGCEFNIEVDQRNYLKRRLDTIRSEKDAALTDKFHMETVYPETKDEIAKALKDGAFELIPSFFDKDGKISHYYSAQSAIRFTDPLRDEEGYKTASKFLGATYTAAKDKIVVLPVADGLKTLQEFEATA